MVGPGQWVVELGWLANCDVPQGKPTAVGQDSACFTIEAGFVSDVHLNVLAEHDVETAVGEGQLGDVCLTDGDPTVQPDKLIKPTRRVAIFFGQIDRRDVASTLVGDEASGAADAAAGIEHPAVTCHADQIH